MHNCKETLPSSVKIGWIPPEADFVLEKQTGLERIKKKLFYIEIKDCVLCSNSIFENVHFLSFFCLFVYFVLSTQLVTFLFSSVPRITSELFQIWRHITTALFNKQTHQALQLLSCVSGFTCGSNFINPRSNFPFFRDLIIVISDLSISTRFVIFCFLKGEEEEYALKSMKTW